MTDNEWILIRNYVEAKACCLMKHEQKPYAKIGIAKENHFEITIDKRRFFIISTNVFYHIIDSVLVEACEKYPTSFGVRRTDKILKAIYEVEKFGSMETFPELLRTEQFAFLIELQNNKVNEKFLRIDLFRKIEYCDSKKVDTDFIGGIFHAFKHFSYKGIPLSTQREINDIEHPQIIFNYIIRAFFFEKHIFDEHKAKGDYYHSLTSLTDTHNLRVGYFLESICKVFFITTFIKQRKEKLPTTFALAIAGLTCISSAFCSLLSCIPG